MICKSIFHLYSVVRGTKTRYLMFKLKKCIASCKYAHFKFVACNAFTKKLGQGHVYHGVASPFLLTAPSKPKTLIIEVLKVKFFPFLA